MKVRVAVPDLVSNSYFPVIAAVELGFFEREGLDASLEVVFPVPAAFVALREGGVDFVATSAHGALWAFPRWEGATVLCALSQGMYWFLVVRRDLPIARGDLSALSGLRLAAAPGVDVGLIMMLEAAGIDLDAQGITVGLPPQGVPAGLSFGVAAAQALIRGEVDGVWANGMAAEVAVSSGVARCVIDVRRGDGPAEAFHYTGPALTTTERFADSHPEECRAAVVAIVKTQKALKADLNLVDEVGKRLFPEREAALIRPLIERDLPYYDARIAPQLVSGMNAFAVRAGLLEGGPVAYEDIVATQFRSLWQCE
ncbi:MAG: ABC transporter substrate-binding protein [Gammaproteobacteria bacterium]|nr:ABC transporter substrate-binding protein [Gammaproteobacteria bacterium]